MCYTNYPKKHPGMFMKMMKGMNNHIPYATYDYNEEKGNYTFRVELPGVEKEGLKVKASDNILRIKAKENIEDEKYSFFRKFEFHRKINPETITAEYKNGLLTLIVPLAEKSESFDVNIN